MVLLFCCMNSFFFSFSHTSSSSAIAITMAWTHLIPSVCPREQIPAISIPTQQQPITAIASQKKNGGKKRIKIKQHTLMILLLLLCIDGVAISLVTCMSECVMDIICRIWSSFFPPYTNNLTNRKESTAKCCSYKAALEITKKNIEGKRQKYKIKKNFIQSTVKVQRFFFFY
jgi:hypothetical protein